MVLDDSYKLSVPLIKKLQAQFERYVTATTTRATAKQYSKCLEIFFSRFPERREPGDFSKLDVMDYRARRRKAGVSARTVNYEVGVVRRFWNWMIDAEAAIVNPASSIKGLRELSAKIVSLSDEQQQRLYQVSLNDSEELLVRLALSTGLRMKTLLQLEKSDFDFAQKRLVIDPAKMKAGRLHILPVRDDVLQLVARLPEGSIWGKFARNDRTLSFKWNKLCKRAGIQAGGLRLARRTVASTLIRNKVPLTKVKSFLGHRSITTTMLYVEESEQEELRDALEQLPKGINGFTGNGSRVSPDVRLHDQ